MLGRGTLNFCYTCLRTLIPTAYFILIFVYTNDGFPDRVVYPKFVLSYPCKAERISFCTGVHSVESAHHNFFLFWLSRNHLMLRFAESITERLNSVRGCLPSDLWTRSRGAMCFHTLGFYPYPPASRIQSFYFCIPHERLRPGGHLQRIFLSTPSPVTQWDRGLKGGHSVIETERASSRTVVTVRRRQLSLLLGYILR